MKVHKELTTARILQKGVKKPCTKMAMQNIVLPTWDDLGLLGMMIRQCVKTKEQPTGNIYDEAKFQTVLRVIDGKVLISGRPDTYCWKMSKVQAAKGIQVVGTSSPSALVTLAEVLSNVKTQEDKLVLASLFNTLNKDCFLIETETEERTCIEVTPELYANHPYCVDEWMETDEKGEAESTHLNIGDFLIVTNDGLYCVRREEFLLTHKF